MRVGLQIAGTITPRSGGEYTFIADLLTALSRRQHTTPHEFVLCYRDGAKALISQFQDFEIINIDSECPPGDDWENRVTGLLHNNGIQFNVLMQHWAVATYDVPYATHLWDVQHRNNPWFPEVSHGGAWEKREALISRILQRATFVITGSETSRKEITRYYRLEEERIRILPFPTPSFALDDRSQSNVPKERRISSDFILYPAQFWPHKNHVLLLDACKEVRERCGWDVELAFVGSDKGNERYVRNHAEDIGISSAVHFLGYVEQGELIRLYKQAFCLGFATFCGPDNLPPLEAFGLGCPVLASDVPGARQQYGNAALLFDPKSVVDFVEKLTELKSPETRRRLIAAGKVRAKTYTWDHYTRDLVAILDDFWPILRSWNGGETPLVVGIDLRFVTREASGGITPLIVETVTALQKRCPAWRFHIFCTMFNRDVIDIVDSHVNHHCLPLDDYYSSMKRILVAEGIQVLFRSFPNDDDLNFPLDKQIVLIPDLQHEFFPDFFSRDALENRRRNFSRLITGCGAVATISAHAESTIRQRYSNRFADVFIMSPSSHILDAKSEEISAAFREEVLALKPYFYFPANLWPHKNHAKLFEAFAIFRANNALSAHNLILTGHRDPTRWKALAEVHSTRNVHHFGFVSKAELAFLYRHATALTLVSLFEGFGMPVLEAFGVGCPVICSNTTSLPDVSGGAALLCDPLVPSKIAAAMRSMALKPKLARKLVEKGRQRFAAFSWSSGAEQLKQAIIRVAARKEDTEAVPAASSSRPLVSIVTPSFNQGRFLTRTIESVLNQSYANVEYIVIDGGSTDDSVDILNGYGNRLRWVSEPDSGQTNAINRGFAQCSGEIRAYLNSDDTLEPTAVEKVIQFFDCHPEIGLVYGNANYIDTDDKVIGQYATVRYSFERLVHDCCICQPAAFWRFSVVEVVGMFDESLNYAMDYDYWLRIANAGVGVEFVPQILANSRLHPENKTLSAREKIYEEIFTISLRHAGRVSKNYVQGYWHHRLNERNDIVARLGRRVPYFHKLVVEYDTLRHERPGKTHAEASRQIVGLIASSLHARWIGWAKQHPPLALVANTTGVSGVFSDNWLAPQISMSPSPARRRMLVLTGQAPTNCLLSIESGKTLVAQQPILANTPTRIEFAGSGEAIRLEFDRFIKRGNRKLAFLVEYTNCFSEDEIDRTKR